MKASALSAAIVLALGVSSVNATPLRLWVDAAAPGIEQLESATAPNLLLLRAGVFNPGTQALRFASDTLTNTKDSRYAVIQFDPANAPSAEQLRALDLTVVGFVPNSAYVVRVGAVPLTKVAAHPAITWADGYVAGWKVEPSLLLPGPTTARGSGQLEIDGFSGESAERLAQAIAKLAPEARVDSLRSDAVNPRVRIDAPLEQLTAVVEKIAAIEGVAWIAPYVEPRLTNDDSIGPMQANAATGTPIWDRGIIGSGQIVAVADSGLDHNESWFTRYNTGPTDTATPLLTDAENTTPPAVGTSFPTHKVYGYWVQPGATGYDNNQTCPGGSPTSFHGTHTSGTVAGDRGATATTIAPAHDALGDDGMAPNAQILFQDIGNDTSGCLSGLGNLQATIRQARNGGAHLSSNSWGASTAGAYSGNDVDVDRASWELQDMLFVVAAGNDGSAATSIGSPGNAKNALTVGALGHGNSTTVASFSSRGPTTDARFKPDIMAPGTSIVSASGNADNSNTEVTGTSKALSGTSMATPTVAGSAALMRQYFEDGYYPRGAITAADKINPNGPMMKAILLNGAAITGTWPSNSTGWGRLYLEGSLYFNAAIGGGAGDSRRMRLFERDRTSGVATGDTHSYTLSNVGAGQELRVTMTWYDPEGGLGAAVSLVNNLDLEVVGPGGTNVYKGNVFTGGISQPNTGTADARNTVEQVRLTAPTAGEYTIRVKGTAVPGNGREYSARQGYAVAVSGEFGVPDSAAQAAPTAVAVTSNNASGIGVGFTGTAPNGFQLYRADGTCASADPKEFRLVQTGATSPLVDDRTQGGYTYAYKLRGVANDVEGTASACVDAVSADACTLQPTFNIGGSTGDYTNASCSVVLNWAAGASNCPTANTVSYKVQRATSPYATFTDLTTVSGQTTYTDSAVTGGTPYFYRVVAIDGLGNQSQFTNTLNATPVGTNGPIGPIVDDVDSGSFMSMASPWRISNVRASTGTLSYHNANDNQTYTSDTCAAITSIPFTVPAGGTLQYAARYNLEQNWDGVVVEISTDNGATWTDLPPTGGYPSSFSQTGSPPVNACAFAATHGAFSGSSGGVFTNFSTSLASFAGQTVKVRWVFSSDPASEEEGFYLDNVQLPQAGNLPDAMNRAGFEDSDVPPTVVTGSSPGCTP